MDYVQHEPKLKNDCMFYLSTSQITVFKQMLSYICTYAQIGTFVIGKNGLKCSVVDAHDKAFASMVQIPCEFFDIDYYLSPDEICHTTSIFQQGQQRLHKCSNKHYADVVKKTNGIDLGEFKMPVEFAKFQKNIETDDQSGLVYLIQKSLMKSSNNNNNNNNVETNAENETTHSLSSNQKTVINEEENEKNEKNEKIVIQPKQTHTTNPRKRKLVQQKQQQQNKKKQDCDISNTEIVIDHNDDDDHQQHEPFSNDNLLSIQNSNHTTASTTTATTINNPKLKSKVNKNGSLIQMFQKASSSSSSNHIYNKFVDTLDEHHQHHKNSMIDPQPMNKSKQTSFAAKKQTKTQQQQKQASSSTSSSSSLFQLKRKLNFPKKIMTLYVLKQDDKLLYIRVVNLETGHVRYSTIIMPRLQDQFVIIDKNVMFPCYYQIPFTILQSIIEKFRTSDHEWITINDDPSRNLLEFKSGDAINGGEYSNDQLPYQLSIEKDNDNDNDSNDNNNTSILKQQQQYGLFNLTFFILFFKPRLVTQNIRLMVNKQCFCLEANFGLKTDDQKYLQLYVDYLVNIGELHKNCNRDYESRKIINKFLPRFVTTSRARVMKIDFKTNEKYYPPIIDVNLVENSLFLKYQSPNYEEAYAEYGLDGPEDEDPFIIEAKKKAEQEKIDRSLKMKQIKSRNSLNINRNNQVKKYNEDDDDDDNHNEEEESESEMEEKNEQEDEYELQESDEQVAVNDNEQEEEENTEKLIIKDNRQRVTMPDGKSVLLHVKKIKETKKNWKQSNPKTNRAMRQLSKKTDFWSDDDENENETYENDDDKDSEEENQEVIRIQKNQEEKENETYNHNDNSDHHDDGDDEWE